MSYSNDGDEARFVPVCLPRRRRLQPHDAVRVFPTPRVLTPEAAVGHIITACA